MGMVGSMGKDSMVVGVLVILGVGGRLSCDDPPASVDGRSSPARAHRTSGCSRTSSSARHPEHPDVLRRCGAGTPYITPLHSLHVPTSSSRQIIRRL